MNDLQCLLLRGLKGFFSAKPADMLRELAEGVGKGKYHLLLSRYKGFSIVTLPETPFESPQVLHFYSENKAVTRRLVTATLDFVKKQGYNKLVAVNGSGASDEVWSRTFHHEGWKINPVKTVFEFEVDQ